MATLIRMYYDFMDKNADPRVKHWTFMDNPLPTLGFIGFYLLLVLYILPTYMKNRKPYKLTQTIKIYNVIQVVTCAVIIYNMLNAGWIQGDYSYGCAPIDYSDNPRPVALLTQFYWIYYLKGLELVETVFFALRKKFNQISGLHVYHHSSTFMLAWLGCKFIGGGMSSVAVILNSFIHVLMYTYYYLASLGPEWQKTLKVWKPRLTMCQMIQFTILIIHSLTALQPDCKVPKPFLLIYIPNVILIFKMFYDFYQNNYKNRSKRNSVVKLNGVKKHSKTK